MTKPRSGKGKPAARNLYARKPATDAQKALSYASSPLGIVERRLRLLGLPEPVREHRFHPERMWRFDLAWPEHRLAVEYDGGTYSKKPGGHSSIAGMARDREKDAHAMILGWSVIRLDARTFRVQGPEWVQAWFKARGIA